MRRLFSRFKKSQKSYSRKMFLFYSLFTVVVICSSSFVMMQHLNKNLEREIYLSHKRLLTQIQIFSDMYLIERINSLILERTLATARDTSILDFINNKGSGAEDLFKVQQSVSGTLISNPFIHSIYFYRKADDTVVSTREGIVSGILSTDNHNRNYINTALIEQSLDPVAGQNWISPAENHAFWEDRAIISFSQPIPLYSDKSTLKGSVIVNIDEEVFFAAIGKVTDTNAGELMIVDSQGTFYAHSDKNRLMNPEELPYIEEIRKQDSGFCTYSSQGRYWGVTWIQSSMNDWKYVFTVPIEILNKELILTRQFIAVILLLTVVLSITGLNVITAHLYKPFKKLVNRTSELLNINAENTNELSFMNNVLLNLSDRMKEMDKTLEENRTLIRHKLVMDLLHGNIQGEEEIYTMLELADIHMVSGPYGLLLTEINPEVFDRLSVEQRQFLSYTMITALNGFFAPFGVCVSICHSCGCFATLMNADDFSGIQDGLYSLLRQIESEFGLAVNIAASESVDHLKDLAETYSLSVIYLKYNFIYGYGNVFTPEMMRRYEGRSGSFGLEDLNRMEAQLKSGRIEAVKEEVFRQTEEIRQCGYSYNYSRNVLFQMINLFFRVSEEQGLSHENLLTTQFYGISSMDDCIHRMTELLEAYKEKITVRNASVNQEFIAGIEHYVRNHIEKQLSLNAVAEEFDITPNYLSRIYKETMGIHFSDFLIQVKFEKAVELLSSSRNRDIASIAERLGYMDLRYFSKLFKEKYGMTPIQYAKIHSRERSIGE